eukprot:TRINITY_DN16008_c0_g2_i1.p1 TRINITY_DN16008_c0_g2~~TRINITY_DN16008_c0_g2_i1.p1  ORF type:complete len:479 (-),score=111.79 TRINITY_DN16008_c0_g2_i1:147-1583(-)
MARTAGLVARWVPQDFTEASLTGGLYSIIAWLIMLAVFICELASFLQSDMSSMFTLDRRSDMLYEINMDVDMYDIACNNVRVLCISQSNDEPLDTVAQNIYLRPLDGNGKPVGKPRLASEEAKEGVEATYELLRQRKITEVVKADGKEELDSDWLSSHDGFKHKSFEHVIQAHNFTFINFFASWCSHCQHFAPTWVEIAEQVNGKGDKPPLDLSGNRVQLIKLNCVDFAMVCRQLGINAYPMMRLYKNDGSFVSYPGRRTKDGIIDWITAAVKSVVAEDWARDHDKVEKGCNVQGFIRLPRVPGHLELMAAGGDQDLNPKLTNVSHRVNHLSFADPEGMARNGQGKWASHLFGLSRYVKGIKPLDGKTYLTNNFHEAWIHELKVVNTVSHRGESTYQFTHQHRISTVADDTVPQAQFHFDFEPYSIKFERDGKAWYEFVTSMMALVGGVYATMRLMTTTSLGVISGMTSSSKASRLGD